MADGDCELAQAASRGDLDALSELLQTHGAVVRRGLAGRVGQRLQPVLDVEDVMQVTYLEAFLRINHFVYQGRGSFAAWLQHIARNNLRDAVRELRRDRRPQGRQQVGFDSGSSSASILLNRLSGDSSTPSRQAACREGEEILKRAITRLPEDYRRVVEICDIEGRSTCEAAGVLNRSQGAVCMLRARAHDRLRELLGPKSRFFSDSG
ncbi:MAG: sigma-70 family RNA polymerase sigma factor [Phycisphaerae bacterium]|nr:sigma-70 family RNA polymerase sigma factor [Phycisphaerae bacterium]